MAVLLLKIGEKVVLQYCKRQRYGKGVSLSPHEFHRHIVASFATCEHSEIHHFTSSFMPAGQRGDRQQHERSGIGGNEREESQGRLTAPYWTKPLSGIRFVDLSEFAVLCNAEGSTAYRHAS